MKRLVLVLSGLILAALALSACGLASPRPPAQTQSGDAIYTAVAQTVVAQVTLSAGQTAIAQLTQIAVQATPGAPTATLSGNAPPPAIATPSPTIVIPTEIQPTAIPPSPTPIPPTPVPPTPIPPTPIPCDWAQFVRDVSVPDGTLYGPGTPFTKIWRLRNAGTCTWTGNYYLTFVSGDLMDGDTSVRIGSTVYPGETIDVAVDLVAPTREGHYRGDWMLENTNGYVFGVGPDAGTPIWVDIQVERLAQTGYAFDFAANYCAAVWRSGAGRLPCPAAEESEDGGAILLDRPSLESGRTEDELTIWTIPENVRGGWIMGTFPAYRVVNGDHFLAEVGCLADSRGCDVTFSVDYRGNDGVTRNLGQWRETFDGSTTRIDQDLSFLTGQYVEFSLVVTNNGKPAQANAFWLAPSIRSAPAGSNNPAAQAARQRVARDLGLATNQVSITSVEAAQWEDSCLGVRPPGTICTPVIVSGFRVILSAGNRQFEAHVNQDGSSVYWFEF